MSDNQHTILVVDPDERSYKTFDSVLGVNNKVLFVPNSKTAIDLPKSHSIDIVFISQALNGIDGAMLLSAFKKRFPSIPVVLLADRPNVDEVIAAFRSGARELLVKPLDKKELVTVTQKIFGFISTKKPKRRWFFAGKKKTQSDSYSEKEEDLIEKTDQKFENATNSSAGASDVAEMKEAIPLEESAGNPLILDTPLDPELTHTEKLPAEPAESAQPLIEAFYFGSFRVMVNHQPIEDWPGKKGKSIFAYLLLHHRKKIFRDVLMDLFWKKSSPDSARNCLNVSIHGLRRVLQDIDPHNDYILFKDECYYFNSEVDIRLDVEAFRSIWQKAQSTEHRADLAAAVSEYERALDLYQGDFLENELYDGWSSLDKENLKEVYLVILDKISENLMHQNNHRKAIRVCEQILEKDNCREDIYRRLMVCYYRAGQRDKSLKLFRKCTRVLKEELEVKLATSTIELYKKIRENDL